jgi:hypothetical protein
MAEARHVFGDKLESCCSLPMTGLSKHGQKRPLRVKPARGATAYLAL